MGMGVVLAVAEVWAAGFRRFAWISSRLGLC